MAKSQKHKQGSLIPKSVANIKEEKVFLNKNIALLESWKEEGNKANIFVSLRFVNHDFQCFSQWSREEMKCFWDFQTKISNTSWQLLYSQNGKTDKVGFAYTEIKRETYPKSTFKEELSPDITLFEVRANNKIRLHGFRYQSIFYICWLDKNHEICK